MDGDGVIPLVIDWGTHTTKIGFGGQALPASIVPTVLGRPRQKLPPGYGGKTHWCGADALANRGVLFLKRYGGQDQEMTWEHGDAFFMHCFYNQLRVAPEEHPLLITCYSGPEAATNHVADLLIHMFEVFNLPALYLIPDAVCALRGAGRTTGLVTDIGHKAARVTPVYEGSVLQGRTQAMYSCGGYAVQETLINLLIQKGVRIVSHGERDEIESIKDSFCHVAKTNEEYEILKNGAPSKSLEKYCEVKPGDKSTGFTLGNERFQAPEQLFNPSSTSIQQMILDALYQSPALIRQELASNAVLVGGGALFPGLKERLTSEATKKIDSVQCPHFDSTAQVLTSDKMNLFWKIPPDMINQTRRYIPPALDFKLTVPPDPAKLVTWIGGSMISRSDGFESMCISNADYYEYGPQIHQRMCW